MSQCSGSDCCTVSPSGGGCTAGVVKVCSTQQNVVSARRAISMSSTISVCVLAVRYGGQRDFVRRWNHESLMRHVRPRIMPRTQKCLNVIALVSSGEPLESVADASMDAAKSGLDRVTEGLGGLQQ